MNVNFNDVWSAIGALAALGGVYGLGFQRGSSNARKTLNNERERNRLSEVYAPLVGLFADCHISTSTARLAPHLWHRVHFAKRFLGQKRIAEAFKALFDKRVLPETGGVEYGESFPLVKISTHLKGREKFADSELLDLVRSANRARHEEPRHRDLLTTQELLLLKHIHREHVLLSRKFA